MAAVLADLDLGAMGLCAGVEGLLVRTMSVMQTCFRPYAKDPGGHWTPDARTTLYAAVLAENEAVADALAGGAHADALNCAVGRLQQAVFALVNAGSAKNTTGGPEQTKATPLLALARKDGRLRENILAKCARLPARPLTPQAGGLHGALGDQLRPAPLPRRGRPAAAVRRPAARALTPPPR